MRQKFAGILAPLVTPIKSNGDVDKAVLKRLVNYVLKNGADVLMPVAGTGEGVSLSHKQRMQTVQTVVDEVQGKCPVVPGAVVPGLGDRIDETLEYKKIGADGVMLLTPYYVDFKTQEDLVEYFVHFLEMTGMPLMIENLPSRTNNNMQPESYLALHKKNELFTSVKECVPDLGQYSRVIKLLGDRIDVLCGYESMLAPTLMLGGHGGVIAIANIFPQVLKRLLNAAKEKDIDTVNKIHFEIIIPLNSVIFSSPHPGPLRVALKYLGIDTGHSVLPVKEPSTEIQENVIKTVKQVINKTETLGI